MLNLHINTEPSYLQINLNTVSGAARLKSPHVQSSLRCRRQTNYQKIAILKCGIGNQSWATARLFTLRSITFTITAEILARSLANFYRQYADRHMNLKFVRRVSERERAIRPFVIVKNKLMSVFNESVLLLTMNFVITLPK